MRKAHHIGVANENIVPASLRIRWTDEEKRIVALHEATARADGTASAKINSYLYETHEPFS